MPTTQVQNLAPYITAVFTFLSTVILGLIAWGLKAELAALRSEFRLGLASAEARFLAAVKEEYVRKEICKLQRASLLCSACEAKIHARNLTN